MQSTADVSHLPLRLEPVVRLRSVSLFRDLPSVSSHSSPRPHRSPGHHGNSTTLLHPHSLVDSRHPNPLSDRMQGIEESWHLGRATAKMRIPKAKLILDESKNLIGLPEDTSDFLDIILLDLGPCILLLKAKTLHTKRGAGSLLLRGEGLERIITRPRTTSPETPRIAYVDSNVALRAYTVGNARRIMQLVQ